MIDQPLKYIKPTSRTSCVGRARGSEEGALCTLSVFQFGGRPWLGLRLLRSGTVAQTIPPSVAGVMSGVSRKRDRPGRRACRAARRRQLSGNDECERSSLPPNDHGIRVFHSGHRNDSLFSLPPTPSNPRGGGAVALAVSPFPRAVAPAGLVANNNSMPVIQGSETNKLLVSPALKLESIPENNLTFSQVSSATSSISIGGSNAETCGLDSSERAGMKEWASYYAECTNNRLGNLSSASTPKRCFSKVQEELSPPVKRARTDTTTNMDHSPMKDGDQVADHVSSISNPERIGSGHARSNDLPIISGGCCHICSVNVRVGSRTACTPAGTQQVTESLAPPKSHSLLQYFKPAKKQSSANKVYRPPQAQAAQFVELSSCGYCDKATCNMCLQQCENCQQHFCTFCSKTDYTNVRERILCFDCADCICRETQDTDVDMMDL